MKKSNPIYFLVLILTILFIVIFQEKKSQENLKELNNNLQLLKEKATIYTKYKNQWINKSNIEERINKIKNNPIFKSYKIKTEGLENSIRITFNTTNRNKQNSLLNMIMNDYYLIKSMNFTKNNLIIEIEVK